MRLRELSGGVRICPEIRLDSPLYTHNEIALYLASDNSMGHTLVHMLPSETASYTKLEEAVEFYRTTLHVETRCGKYEEFIFFSEPFPLGEYMFEWLERRERVSLAEALKRIIELLKTLNLAHEKGIYHGRITPQSVLLERTESTLALRMMGLGVALALNESIRSDIDWFDYTFDLEGMSPSAVDIYGIAIILMGLVSGESGIDSFEATGLLPQSLRGGIIQQAMERALALRIDAYPNVLAFSQDLEAALLEIDDRQGEVYVGDLVGFESAIKSVTSISEDTSLPENSGVWSSLIGTLEQEERSSLLCSLTSLSAIKPIEDDEDEDITRISSLPKQVLSMQRIKAVHPHDDGKTNVTSRPELSTEEITEDTGRTSVSPEEEVPQAHLSTEERMASLQSLEAELKNDEEEDESPTRVMMRPNYATISFGKSAEGPRGVDSSIEDVLAVNLESSATTEELSPIMQMEKRIRSAVVTEMSMKLGHDVLYDDNDPVAFPEGPGVESVPEQTVNNSLVKNAAETPSSQNNHAAKAAIQPLSASKLHAKHMSDKQKLILRVLVFVVIILVLAVVILKIAK